MKLAQRVRAGIVLGMLLMTLVSPAVAQEYTIRPGDVLEISVLGESQASKAVTVSPDGVLMLPMAGAIPAAGLTLSQLTKKITEQLRQYVRDPQVTVSIRTSQRQFAYVLGQIAHPGAYEISRGWTLSQLVAQAGGATNEAALARTVVMRKEQAIPVDLEPLIREGKASADFALEADDLVIVPETKNRVVVMGAVQKPGPYMFKPGERVVDALSAAGGATSDATKEIGIIRLQGQKPAVTSIDLGKFYKTADLTQNIALQPGDIVYVPEHKAIDWMNLLGVLGSLFLVFK